MPQDYKSFTRAILSQIREIDIAESILPSIKVIIALPRGFPNNDAMGNMATNFSLTAGGVENCCFSALGVGSLQL